MIKLIKSFYGPQIYDLNEAKGILLVALDNVCRGLSIRRNEDFS